MRSDGLEKLFSRPRQRRPPSAGGSTKCGLFLDRRWREAISSSCCSSEMMISKLFQLRGGGGGGLFSLSRSPTDANGRPSLPRQKLLLLQAGEQGENRVLKSDGPQAYFEHLETHWVDLRENSQWITATKMAVQTSCAYVLLPKLPVWLCQWRQFKHLTNKINLKKSCWRQGLFRPMHIWCKKTLYATTFHSWKTDIKKLESQRKSCVQIPRTQNCQKNARFFYLHHIKNFKADQYILAGFSSVWVWVYSRAHVGAHNSFIKCLVVTKYTCVLQW